MNERSMNREQYRVPIYLSRFSFGSSSFSNEFFWTFYRTCPHIKNFVSEKSNWWVNHSNSTTVMSNIERGQHFWIFALGKIPKLKKNSFPIQTILPLEYSLFIWRILDRNRNFVNFHFSYLLHVRHSVNNVSRCGTQIVWRFSKRNFFGFISINCLVLDCLVVFSAWVITNHKSFEHFSKELSRNQPVREERASVETPVG